MRDIGRTTVDLERNVEMLEIKVRKYPAQIRNFAVNLLKSELLSQNTDGFPSQMLWCWGQVNVIGSLIPKVTI